MEEDEAATSEWDHETPESGGQKPTRPRLADARAFIGPKAQLELAAKKQARTEERAWREKVRAEDAEIRQRTERNARLYSALSAAAETAGPGASPEDVLKYADQFLDWLKVHARDEPLPRGTDVPGRG
ncbi:MAG TPA: hypothetical protein VHY79_04455 [Rhizomicrobium sp.]|nr:hypothetical protein [Rhizomicrobium sp.]